MKKTTANEERTYVAPEIEELKIDVQSSFLVDSKCPDDNAGGGDIGEGGDE